MSATALRSPVAPLRATASRSARPSFSLLALLSQSLEFARLVGETGPVDARTLARVQALAKSL